MANVRVPAIPIPLPLFPVNFLSVFLPVKTGEFQLPRPGSCVVGHNSSPAFPKAAAGGLVDGLYFIHQSSGAG
jgi:hypothetical protein